MKYIFNNWILLLIVIVIVGCFQDHNSGEISNLLYECYDTDEFGPLKPMEYGGIPESCLFTISQADYESDDGTWNDPQEEDVYIGVNGGQLITEVDKFINWYTYCPTNDYIIDGDYQVEIKCKILEGAEENEVSINFGGEDVYNKIYQFGITSSGKFSLILKYEDIDPDEEIIYPLTNHDVINKNSFNKLTVRRIENSHYFFINETLVLRQDNLTHYGNEINICTGPHTKAIWDDYSLNKVEL